MALRISLPAIALVLGAGCAATPTATQVSQVFSIRELTAFSDPIHLGNVEFTVELESAEAGRAIEIAPEAILLGGKPLVRRVRYSMYEVAGREHHLVKGDKVYVFLPRESGELDLEFRDVDFTVAVALAGRPDRGFVLVWRVDPEGGQIMYGRAILRRSKDGRYTDRDGKPVPVEFLRRGVRMARSGEVEPRVD